MLNVHCKTPRILSISNREIQLHFQCDCDCDCTCSLFSEQENVHGKQTLSKEPLRLQSFRRSSFSTLNLDNTYKICYGPLYTPVVLNQSAFHFLSSFDQPCNALSIFDTWKETWSDEVIQSTLTSMIALGLLVAEEYPTPQIPESSFSLIAWLHITNHCNLRCAYCYLSSYDCIDMSAKTGRAAIDATFRSALNHRHHKVKLKYAGGEPLFCFPLITELHQYAHTLANRYDLPLDGVILSNGTLLKTEIVEIIQSLGLRLMISLDGIGKFHDCQRPYANGYGSFDDTVHGIEIALAHGLVPSISITVSGRNVEGLPNLLEWVLEHELPFSLNLYRENPLSASQRDLCLEEERIIAGLRAAYQIVEANLPPYSLLGSLLDQVNFFAPHLHSCRAGYDYLVFNTQGQVAKCQMALEQTITDVYNPDPLLSIRTTNIGLVNRSVDQRTSCRDCQWRYWCAGGCPLMTYWVTNRYDTKSPNCNIYRSLFSDIIRLEGLRLLKYAN